MKCFGSKILLDRDTAFLHLQSFTALRKVLSDFPSLWFALVLIQLPSRTFFLARTFASTPRDRRSRQGNNANEELNFSSFIEKRARRPELQTSAVIF